jgi:hypothetical protein
MEKLSLDALKERAESVQCEEILSKIGGGVAEPVQSDCHGIWGGLQKYLEMPRI